MKKQTFSLHFTSLHLAMLLLVLSFVACKKENLANENAKPVTHVTPPIPPSSVSDAVTDRTDQAHAGKCKCQYTVVSVTGSGDPSAGHLEYSVYGGEYFSCDAGCRFFAGYDGDCYEASGSFDPICDDMLTNAPTPYYGFNCQPGSSTSFPVGIVPEWVKSNCSQQGVTLSSASIVIQVRCGRADTPGCGGYVYSNQKTLTNTSPTATLSLGGECYCVPTIE